MTLTIFASTLSYLAGILTMALIWFAVTRLEKRVPQTVIVPAGMTPELIYRLAQLNGVGVIEERVTNQRRTV